MFKAHADFGTCFESPSPSPSGSASPDASQRADTPTPSALHTPQVHRMTSSPRGATKVMFVEEGSWEPVHVDSPVPNHNHVDTSIELCRDNPHYTRRLTQDGLVTSHELEQMSVEPDAPAPAQSVVNARTSTPRHTLYLMLVTCSLRQLMIFPHCLAVHGGGYAVAYVLCLVVMAHPTALLEALLGAIWRKPAAAVFAELHPRWGGVAWAGTIALFVLAAADTVLLGDALVYLGATIRTGRLPWMAPDDSTLPPAYRAFATATAETHVTEYYTSLHDRSDDSAWWFVTIATAALCATAPLLIAKPMPTTLSHVAVLPAVALFAALLRTLTVSGAFDGIQWLCFRAPTGPLMTPAAWAAAAGHALVSMAASGSGLMTTLTTNLESAGQAAVLTRRVLLCNVVSCAFSACLVGGALSTLCDGSDTRMQAVADRTGSGLALAAISHAAGSVGTGANVFSAFVFAGVAVMGWVAPVMYIRGLSEAMDTHLKSMCRAANPTIRNVKKAMAVCVALTGVAAAGTAIAEARGADIAMGPQMIVGCGMLLPLLLMLYVVFRREELVGKVERHAEVGMVTACGWMAGPVVAALTLAVAVVHGVGDGAHEVWATVLAAAFVCLLPTCLCRDGGGSGGTAGAVNTTPQQQPLPQPPPQIVELMTRRRSSLFPMPRQQDIERRASHNLALPPQARPVEGDARRKSFSPPVGECLI